MRAARLAVFYVICHAAFAQKLPGQIDRSRIRGLWLKGDFAGAEAALAHLQNFQGVPLSLIWGAEFESERGRYGVAATLLAEAKRTSLSDNALMAERRLGRLDFLVGRFAEAEKVALEGQRWDGFDVSKLKLNSTISLVTLGDVYMVKGDFAKAIAILQRARAKAKSISSTDGLEWCDSVNATAIAYLGLGSVKEAEDAARQALSGATTTWGGESIPALDALDTLGLVQMAQNDLGDAETSLAHSGVVREKLYPAQHHKLAETYMHAAQLYAARNHMRNALRLTERAVLTEKDFAIGPNGRWALILISAAGIYQKAGRYGDAVECYENALPVLEKELGSGAPAVEFARRNFSALPREAVH